MHLFLLIIRDMKNMKKVTPIEIIKFVFGLTITIAVVYGLVIVPSINLANTGMALERAEARVHYSCDLLARNNTAKAVDQNEAAEEPTEEEINGFFAQQYQNCVLSEGLNPQDLVEKFVQEEEAAGEEA